MIKIEKGKAVLNNWFQRCSIRTPLLRDKKSTKKEVKRRTGKLNGDITTAEECCYGCDSSYLDGDSPCMIDKYLAYLEIL